MSTIVDLVGAFFGSVGSRIANFDTHFSLNITDYIDWAVRRLFSDFIRNFLSKKAVRGLSVTGVTNTETSVLRFVRLDVTNGGAMDQRSIKTPGTSIGLAFDCVARFVGFEDAVLECVLDGVVFAHVFEGLKGVKRGTNVEYRCHRM